MKILMIVAALPPDLDGIGDYTALIAAELAKSVDMTVLTACARPDPICGADIKTVFSVVDRGSVRALEDVCVSECPDWIVLQYCPFSYGKWGLNVYLPEVIVRIKRRSPITRFALMVHEPFVPATSVKLAIMTSWQRWQLHRLGYAADLVLCSIQPWSEKFSRWFPDREVAHLPVGSNIPVVPMDRGEARRRLGIPDDACVLGFFGWMHDSRMTDRIASAAKAVGSRAFVLYIGPNPEAARKCLSDLWHVAEGPFPPDEISRRFAAIDINLSAFHDGISTRRGSLMCALSHGIPSVATRGFNTDNMLLDYDGRAFLLADALDDASWCEHVLRLSSNRPLWADLSHGARQLYMEHFSWGVIARSLLSRMKEISTNHLQTAAGAPSNSGKALETSGQFQD